MPYASGLGASIGFGVESTPLPLPLDPHEVLAATHQRIFITYINPSLEKGVMFNLNVQKSGGN